MRYKVLNPVVTVGTTKSGRYAGQKYYFIQIECFRDDDEDANPNQLPKYVSLNKQFVEHFLENGAGILDQTLSNADTQVYNVDMTKVAEKYQYIDKIVPFTKILPKPLALKDIRTGDYVRNANGSIILRSSVRIMGKRVYDPDQIGMKRADGTISDGWDWKEDMDLAVDRFVERYYRPIDDSPVAPMATPAPAEEATNKIAQIAAMRESLNGGAPAAPAAPGAPAAG